MLDGPRAITKTLLPFHLCAGEQADLEHWLERLLESLTDESRYPALTRQPPSPLRQP